MILIFIISQLIVLIVCLIIEPVHDSAFIQTQLDALNAVDDSIKQKIINRDRVWHIQESFEVSLLYALPCICAYIDNHHFLDAVILYATLLSIRFTFFPISLNNKRGLPAIYIGDKGIDGFFKRIFGRNAGLFKTIAGIILYIGLNLIYFFK